MSLGQGVDARVTVKPYASGAITANALATSSSDLDGSSGGQVLRRTSCTLDLAKDTFQSAEIRSDLQIGDYRHGTKRVQGSIMGELSPGTYWDLIEAACRGTEVAAITASEVDFTSVTADNASSKFTFGAGNPVTKGFRVGMTIRFADLSVSGNNSKNFLILGFGGSNNREVTVYPAPTDNTSDTDFDVVSVGKQVFVPSSGFVSRKFGVEVYHQDLDLYRLFTECRVGGLKFGLPPSGMSTIEIPLMGRDMETGSGGSAPFFQAPTAITTTGILAAVNGLIRVGGSNVGVVTGLSIDMNLNPQADAVVGQNFVPEIFVNRFNVTGQLTAFLQDFTLLNYFKNETEVELLAWMTASNADAADAMSIYLPRLKFGDADIGLQGEQGIPISIPFQALKYLGSGAGIENTTIQFCDTAA